MSDTKTIELAADKFTAHGIIRDRASFIAGALFAKEQSAKKIENLKKIISKEMSENDEFGSEFVLVGILKDEIVRLKSIVELQPLVTKMKEFAEKLNEDKTQDKGYSAFNFNSEGYLWKGKDDSKD